MSIVNVSELKNRLSHYLRLVREGETVIVRDRERVIARIQPAGAHSATRTDDSDWLDELERRGTIRRADGKIARGWLAARPKLAANMVTALLEERDDDR